MVHCLLEPHGMATWTVRIHGQQGIRERSREGAVERPGHARTADRVGVTEIMSREVVCAFEDLPLASLIPIIVNERLGCVPVVDDSGQPMGMVTKFDIVEQLAHPAAHGPLLVSDVMMPLAITVDHLVSVAHVAAMMASEDMHHVIVVSDRQLVGVVSTMDVTRWLALQNERKH